MSIARAPPRAGGVGARRVERGRCRPPGTARPRRTAATIGNIQCHDALGNPFVEGGQLYAFYCPGCVGSCRADVAQPLDGTVGAADLTVLLAAWGQAGPTDLNADGNTDGLDLTILLSSWGACQ